jgi:tetratricopeptide (TPR) repeat protein
MKLSSRLVAAASVVALFAPLAASADNGTENYYFPPKLAKQGTSQTPITGPGQVIVKVLVNPDSSFTVSGVIRSTNHGDDQTALEIAKSSKYVPATRGGKKIVAFYDFTLKFTASGASSSESSEASGLGQYERELRAGNYTGAATGLKGYVTAHPSDAHGQLDLAVADTYLNDYAAAAAAFGNAGDIPANYKAVAAKAYVEDAVSLLNAKDYQNSLVAAKHATAFAPGFATYDTQGMAELGSGDATAALADLQKAHDLAKADVPAKSRAANDLHLMQAYLATGNVDGAKKLQTEALGVNPESKADSETVFANYYVKQAQADESAGKFPDAAALYEQAASVAPSQAGLLYGNAAFSYLKATPQPLNDKAKADADKALAADPNNAAANFAAGVALANSGKKSDALVYLNKADALAKAGNQTGIAASVEAALKQLNGGSAASPAATAAP